MSRRFRIAFSFAGEKRAFVAKAASILAERFGENQILYDKFHEAELARYDLGIYLPKLYSEQSDLIVPVLCPNYDVKQWTGWEWIHIYGLLTKADGFRVMLSRFEYAHPDGLSPACSFIELDHKSPEEFTNLILERLANNEGHPNDHYTCDTRAGHDWPFEAPPLKWAGANQTRTQNAFAQLVTQTPPFRLLLIRGGSDTGKSHLTQQLLNNADRIHGIASARFDFKCGSKKNVALRAFAERLGVSPPEPNPEVANQLMDIFTCLKKAARPTLVIFDTFEQAREAGVWVEENLLLSLVHASWLRVIIVGQQVPTKLCQSWEQLSTDPIELCSPTPEDWFDYGKQHIPDLTLDFVRQAHKLSGGKCTALAQLLEPKA